MEDEPVKALEAGTRVSGRYRVLRCIKAGGMGAVYEVSDANTRRRLALKTLRPGMFPDATLRARFEQEASITASLDSEHVVKVEDFGIDEATGLAFFTMDLLAGRDLDTVLKEEGPLPAQRVVGLLWQVALALGSIHEAGIVHRDIKPENLFLKRRDDQQELIKILDFGVAKVLESDPKTTAFVGTPLYMPPEQLRGEPPDPRTDVYALGQVTFTLLTGRAFLEPGHAEEPATRRAERFGVQLPAAFDGWFERATALRIAERFDSATELVIELCQALGVQLPEPRASLGPVARSRWVSTLGHDSLSPRPAGSERTLDSGGQRAPSTLESQTTAAVSGGPRSPARSVGLLGPVLGILLVLGIVIAIVLRRSEPPAATPLPVVSAASPEGPSLQQSPALEPTELTQLPPSSSGPVAGALAPAPTPGEATSTVQPRPKDKATKAQRSRRPAPAERTSPDSQPSVDELLGHH